ncbi:branched-chain amino acid ABC transporter permease [Bacillus coahuilensis m2-6]|uniref:AzlC family ABC transporter permease n=1 Tax=Bacillus coahuilensis TaxID=408580 RepID=UPI0007501BDB|nr:AzlC family ABC transporter permease [Bacillus coahuilensis]KUP09197.1 branched-chain amino acid ABC transporter permease [Bacillus coahuilensis m2-6]
MNQSFLSGIRGGLSIAIGYFPIAVAFGLLAKNVGLTSLETVMMSIFVFAGAAQFMSLNLIALGTAGVEIVLTTFIVNIRHLLMSASLNEKMHKDKGWKRALYAFGITDETFSVLATKPGPITSQYAFGVILCGYSSWVFSSFLGFIIGSFLPVVLQESMSIALYSMFVGLLVPSMKKSVKVFSLAFLSAAFHSIFFVAGLSTGWAILFASLLSAVLVELITTVKGRGAVPRES